MRIVGGTHRGRRLLAPGPNEQRIRPTSDRVREAIFDILAHGAGGVAVELTGARVIDLFAGTGALGLEALSRGAAFALFVEEDPRARGLIRTNIETLGLDGQARVFRRNATRLGHIGTMAPFDLGFVDPPYGKGLGEGALLSLAEGAWLAPGARLVLEEAAEAVFALPAGFMLLDERRYGDTAVRFLSFGRDSDSR